MYTHWLTLLFLSVLWLPAQAQQTAPDSTSEPNRAVFTVVQQHPEFPGGMHQLGEYLKKNTQRPKSGQGGRVFVNFIVNEQGGIEDVHVLKGLGPELDAEAVRLVQRMPIWIPGRQNGKAVACRYNLPINF